MLNSISTEQEDRCWQMRALHAVPSALLRSAVLCIGTAEAQHSLDEALAVGDVRGAVPDESRELDGDE